MATYELPTPARSLFVDSLAFERHEFEWPAGKVTPKNEAEEEALQALVADGAARVSGKD